MPVTPQAKTIQNLLIIIITLIGMYIVNDESYAVQNFCGFHNLMLLRIAFLSTFHIDVAKTAKVFPTSGWNPINRKWHNFCHLYSTSIY